MKYEEDYLESTCVNMDEGWLVFEPRAILTEEQKERADLHVGDCPACQSDMEFDYLMSRMNHEKE